MDQFLLSVVLLGNCQSWTLYAQGHSTPCISRSSYKDTTPNRWELWYKQLYLGTRTAKYLEHDQWTQTTECCINIGFLTSIAAPCAKWGRTVRGESRESSKQS